MKKTTKCAIFDIIRMYLAIPVWWVLYLTGNIFNTPTPLT